MLDFKNYAYKIYFDGSVLANGNYAVCFVIRNGEVKPVIAWSCPLGLTSWGNSFQASFVVA